MQHNKPIIFYCRELEDPIRSKRIHVSSATKYYRKLKESMGKNQFQRYVTIGNYESQQFPISFPCKNYGIVQETTKSNSFPLQRTMESHMGSREIRSDENLWESQTPHFYGNLSVFLWEIFGNREKLWFLTKSRGIFNRILWDIIGFNYGISRPGRLSSLSLHYRCSFLIPFYIIKLVFI